MSEWDEEEETVTPYQTFTIDDLDSLPDPSWLVADIIPEHSYGTMYGVPGVGKSFAMLDLLLCIASGIPWHGHKTVQGPVTYFAGEGVRGLKKRVRAWLAAHPDVDRSVIDVNFRVVPLVPSFASKLERERVIATTGHSAMVVFDTLARGMSAGGLDENKASDMGAANDFCETIRNRTGAACWAVHHTGKDGSAERGSVALRGACDTMVLVKPDDGGLVVAVSKQKDAREASPIRFVLDDVPGTGSAVLHREESVAGAAAAFINAQAKFGVRTAPTPNPWMGDF